MAAAAEAGADLLGFVLAPESPRAAMRVLPVPDETLAVAVWVGEAGESIADLDQVHTVEEGKVRGREATALPQAASRWHGCSTSRGRKTIRVTGSTPPRPRAGSCSPGGLGPENVAEAIAAVRPWAVDASSSLETAPGIKDHARVRAYVEAARS